MLKKAERLTHDSYHVVDIREQTNCGLFAERGQTRPLQAPSCFPIRSLLLTYRPDTSHPKAHLRRPGRRYLCTSASLFLLARFIPPTSITSHNLPAPTKYFCTYLTYHSSCLMAHDVSRPSRQISG